MIPNDTRPEAAEILTPTEVCERYRLRLRTLERMRVSGDGPAFVRVGRRRILYRALDVERWLAARTFVSRAAELAVAAAAE